MEQKMLADAWQSIAVLPVKIAEPQYRRFVEGFGTWRIEFVRVTSRWHLTAMLPSGEGRWNQVNSYLTEKDAVDAVATLATGFPLWDKDRVIAKEEFVLSCWERVDQGREPK
jgi:hypothetical protein